MGPSPAGGPGDVSSIRRRRSRPPRLVLFPEAVPFLPVRGRATAGFDPQPRSPGFRGRVCAVTTRRGLRVCRGGVRRGPGWLPRVQFQDQGLDLGRKGSQALRVGGVDSQPPTGRGALHGHVQPGRPEADQKDARGVGPDQPGGHCGPRVACREVAHGCRVGVRRQLWAGDHRPQRRGPYRRLPADRCRAGLRHPRIPFHESVRLLKRFTCLGVTRERGKPSTSGIRPPVRVCGQQTSGSGGHRAASGVPEGGEHLVRPPGLHGGVTGRPGGGE